MPAQNGRLGSQERVSGYGPMADYVTIARLDGVRTVGHLGRKSDAEGNQVVARESGILAPCFRYANRIPWM